ncbi:MAG: LPS export ABC transporter periplasmic protein LptC [Acidobacteriia bacterium]|nr:LPS export ABC transporter periplasmic protein LptC [Terriglobia bacterium]
MRRTRRVFLVAILAILCGVGATYYLRLRMERRKPVVVPKSMRANVQMAGQDWVYRKDDGQRPIVEVRAKDMERVEKPAAKTLLKGVELRLFHKEGRTYDLVKSASAEFDEGAGSLFSGGAVEITLAVPAEGEPKGRLLSIQSSAVRFDAATGKATTDAPARFSFDLGDGEAVGASYDPRTRELQLHNRVVLRWRGNGPNQKLMVIEAGQLVYRESESKVLLGPWSRMKREQLSLSGAATEITLEQGNIRRVDTRQASGEDAVPGRRMKFGADQMHLDLSAKSEIEKITGVGKARLETLSDGGQTIIRTDQVVLDFEVRDKESILRKALAHGGSVLESHPVAKAGEPKASRILRSEVVEIQMRPDGEEIEMMQTHSPGTLDLTPGKAGQPKRQLTAERMTMVYGAKNQLRSFRGVQVTTKTMKPAMAKQRQPAPALTSSRDMTAEFHPATGEMTRMEQWNDFKYREGEQQATAAKATLDQALNLIVLSTGARVWDPTGSVKADQIEMNQASGDFTAVGKVESSRLPEKQSSSGGMLAQDEPMQAKAARMVSTGGNQHIVYEGDAVLWQTTNRLQADRVVIQRKDQKLLASGKVVSQFLDNKKTRKKDETAEPVLTLVRSDTLDYDDRQKMAWYKGHVRLLRGGMDVKSKELRAFLEEEKNDKEQAGSSLNRAFADGDVEIFQAAPGRTRRGSSEHAEYYVADEKVILKGGNPQMVDSVKGTTRGRELTYWANSDSLQVDGAPAQPVVSKIRRK